MRAKFLYRYNSVKITDGWKHPVSGVEYKRVNWFDSQSDSQLEALGVTRHEWPVPPAHDPYYQTPVEQQSGEYKIENLPLEDVKAKKKAEILSVYETKMQMVRAGYSDSEIASWVKQELEANAWTEWQSNGAPETDEPVTPLLDGIATARGVDKSVLVGKVLQKAAAATPYTAQMTGIKQSLEDAVDACSKGAEVKAVEWQ